MIKDENPDCRGKPRLTLSTFIDFGGKCVDGDPAFGGNDAQGIPECRLQRDTGAVAMQGQRVFDRACSHARTL
jgi:hypothetical protein